MRIQPETGATTRSLSAGRQILRSPMMVTALACVLLGAMDLTVVAAIMPAMIDDLGINTADVDRYIWAVNIYLISYVVAIPIAGRVSDVLGRRPVFVVSLILFGTGSAWCATAHDLTHLVIGRGIQGFGAGALLPLAMALAGDTLSARARLSGIGIVSATETIGWILGPAYGALIADVLHPGSEAWRWVFWINIPILAILVLLVIRFREHQPTRSSVGRVDVPGAVLLTLALVGVNLALATGGELGSSTGSGLRALGGTENPLGKWAPWLLGGALVATAVLWLWETRTRFPLLPIEHFRMPNYRAAIYANLGVGAVLMVALVNIPVLVALTAGNNDVGVESALMMAPLTIGVAAGSLLHGPLANRIRPARLLSSASAMVVTGCVLIGTLAHETHIWRLIPGLVLAGFGIGLVMPPLATIPLQLAGSRDRGAAASSALLFRLLGMTVGISTLTALGVHRLQILSNRIEPVVRKENEPTASFLLRQQQFIVDHAVPLSVQVVRETFLVAAVIGAITAIPIYRLVRVLGVYEDQEPIP